MCVAVGPILAAGGPWGTGGAVPRCLFTQAKPVRTESFHWNLPNPMASTASSTMKVSGKEKGEERRDQ